MRAAIPAYARLGGELPVERVRVVTEGYVAIATIDNPPVNVLDAAVVRDLLDAFDEFERQDVRAVVLCGAGSRAFVAGADIREFPAALGQPGAPTRLAVELHGLMNRVERFARPVIAALHGFVLGGGLELALSCDLRIADATAQLGLPEVKLGILPGAGGTQRLPRLVGAARAKQLLFTGDPISAATAEQWGLVNAVAPPGGAVEAASALARTIAARTPQALSRIKRAVDAGADLSLEHALALEIGLFEEVFHTDDSREGIQAFLDKRAPQMKGR